MEMADAIVINKADGDNIKEPIAKSNSTEPASFSCQKNQAGHPQLRLVVPLLMRNTRSLANHSKF
jgi:putative protein kinase ArgK-like GTPase of G3E family